MGKRVLITARGAAAKGLTCGLHPSAAGSPPPLRHVRVDWTRPTVSILDSIAASKQFVRRFIVLINHSVEEKIEIVIKMS